MNSDELFAEFERDFSKGKGRRPRRFLGGLLPAFIDLYLEPDIPAKGFSDFDNVLSQFPRQKIDSKGDDVKQLGLYRSPTSSEVVTIRPLYNKIERFYQVANGRLGFPSCGPHSTQGWTDYRHWLDALATYDRQSLLALRQKVVDYVLDYFPDQRIDPASVRREPPVFDLLIADFVDSPWKIGRSGAALQGLIYGFLRSENSHLQLEVRKTRTGGARVQRIGDIDAFNGARLAVTAEVKQSNIGDGQVDAFVKFGNGVSEHHAIGIVAALEFSESARAAIELLGLRTLDLQEIGKIVQLWDPTKQRSAISFMAYFYSKVENSAELTNQLNQFIEQIAAETNAPGT